MLKPKKNISEAKGYKTQMFLEDFELKLDLNENLLGPSPKVLDAVKTITREEIQFYPAYGKLVEAISSNIGVEQDMVLPTNGADEGLCYVFQTFIEKDDKVLTVVPTFAMSKIYATSTGCQFIEIPYKEKWVFPIEEFLSSINEETKMVIITTPNNPTGELISDFDLNKIIEKASHSIVLIDETYATYANKTYVDIALKNKNVILVKSMSKDFAIAGLRLGYIVSNEANLEYIRRVSSPFSVNIIAAKAGVAAMNDIQYFEKVRTEINSSKEKLKEIFEPFALKVYNSSTNFVLFDFGEKAEYIYYKLLRAGVKTKLFKDKVLNNHIRMSVPPLNKCNYIKEALKSKPMIVFDMDGVLIDTTNSYRKAIKATYEHFVNKPLSVEEIQSAKNRGGLNNDWDLTEFLIQNPNIKSKNIISKFQEFYWGNTGDGLIRDEELIISKEELEVLSLDYELAIFTGRPKEEALFALKYNKIEHLFGIVIGMEDVKNGKPSPDGLRKILEIANPAQVYYLGDTIDDMILTQETRAVGIGVLPPQDKSENLKLNLLKNGADKVLESTKDLKNLLINL
jgi:histidinol-phosphate aminotransferase